jgi:hypothetical protein
MNPIMAFFVENFHHLAKRNNKIIFCQKKNSIFFAKHPKTFINNQHVFTHCSNFKQVAKGHKRGKVCQLETLDIFLDNIHKVYINRLNP